MNGVSHELLGRLRKTTLVVQTRKRGAHKGLRRSHKFGSSLEFSDFRAYQPGDDLRQIDWNIYGRTQKHYIKRYLDEQEVKTAIYLDCTKSVSIIPSKWERAKQLAATLSYIALSNEDQVSFTPVANGNPRVIQRKGAVQAKATLFDIINLSNESTSLTFTESLHTQLMKDKQLTIIITDGLEALEKYDTVLKKLAFLNGDVWFIQMLNKLELEPDYQGDVKLIDSETSSELNISMRPKIISQYEQRLHEHLKNLKKICDKYGFRYLPVNDEKTVDEILLRDCISHGWIR